MTSAERRLPMSIADRIGNFAVTVWPSSLRRARRALRRAWGRVRWKLVAIIILTLSSTLLVASLAIATLNVVVRRESTNIVEKQIQTLVQASRRIALPFWTALARVSYQAWIPAPSRPCCRTLRRRFPKRRFL